MKTMGQSSAKFDEEKLKKNMVEEAEYDFRYCASPVRNSEIPVDFRNEYENNQKSDLEKGCGFFRNSNWIVENSQGKSI